MNSPESKAQVSFSEQNLSVVRHCCCCHRCCRKLFTVLSFLLNNFSNFNHIFYKAVLDKGMSMFFSNVGLSIFQGEIITKRRELLNLPFQNHRAAQLRQPIENSLVLCHLKTLRLYTVQGFSSLSLTIT